MKNCKNAKRYKGLRAPTCNGGRPCESCLIKFGVETLKRARKQ